ncbi:MAG: LAGLIDADG family homing endonuclease [Candidatus Lokiarchaeota archaeon]|nr:LAGLIDADG family homing endonuclease [Candidatus Lokiarchaeota archaeon]
MNADNQQERLDANWIVGFTDGEGCFHVSINKLPKMNLGWQVLPEFRIVQKDIDEQALYKIKNYFGFGEVKINRIDRHGTRKDFKVRGLENLNKIIEKMNNKEHLKKDGLDNIAQLISKMNRQPNIKYLESSETLCSTQI